jgi:hypothetical protein
MDYTKSEGGILLPQARVQVGGFFTIEHVRQGEVIDKWEDHNLVVNEGLDYLLDVAFHGASQVTTWYIGLFEGNYTPVNTLTAATVAAAATESTAYDETTRQEYVESASSGQQTTNSASKAAFTINATKSIYGAFLASASAKGATTGKLLSASRFSAAKAVVAADQLLLTYTFAATSA